MAKLTSRATLQKEYKAETDAAWEAMSKRFTRATAKLHRGLDALAKAEIAAGMKPHK